MRIFILIFIILSSPLMAETKIVFLNGIDGTVEKSRSSAAELKSAIIKSGYAEKFRATGAKIGYWYNPGDGFFDDKIELYKQAELSADALNSARIHDSEASAQGQLYTEILGHIYDSKIKNGAADIEEARHIYSIVRNFTAFLSEEILVKKNKIIVVAHSQGNFFSEAVAAYIGIGKTDSEIKELENSLRFVGAASVAASTPNNRYISLSEDEALTAHAIATASLSNFSLLPRNHAVCESSDPACIYKLESIDFVVHGFMEIYLSDLSDRVTGKPIYKILTDLINDSFDDLVAPTSITNFTPKTAIVGYKTTFAIIGSNLPADTLEISFDGCADIVFGATTSSEQTFTCTPTSPGNIKAVIRKKANSPVLAEFDVEVTAAVSASPIPLLAVDFLRGLNVALSSADAYGADVLLNAPPYSDVPNGASWDFSVAKAGNYELFAEYAMDESRPVVISFNGTPTFMNALADVTGGRFPANQKSFSQGVVSLPKGTNSMRVERDSVFPHIRSFRLMPVSVP